MTRGQEMFTQYFSLILLTKLLTLRQARAESGLGRSCETDAQCRTFNTALRCYSKPGLVDFSSRRCQCRSGWKESGRQCRPPPGWKAETESSPPEVDYVAILTPTVLLSTATLVISICACYYVHSGNTELHRELKREHSQTTARAASVTARENKYRPQEQPPRTPHIEVALSDSESEEDERPEISVELPEIPNSINLNITDTVEEEKEEGEDHQEDQSSRLSPAPSSVSGTLAGSVAGSRVSVRSVECVRSGLHPLPGLVQPTGVVRGPGYQANMRLLFRQRPASATSLAAGLTDQHLVMKSRPASAISRIDSSTRPASAISRIDSSTKPARPTSILSSEPQETELMSSSRPGDEEVGREEIRQEESRFNSGPSESEKHKPGPSPSTNNGIIKNGHVTNGFRKISSESNCSKSSVRFATEIVNGKIPLKKKTSTSSISSGKPVRLKVKIRNIKKKFCFRFLSRDKSQIHQYLPTALKERVSWRRS